MALLMWLYSERYGFHSAPSDRSNSIWSIIMPEAGILASTLAPAPNRKIMSLDLLVIRFTETRAAGPPPQEGGARAPENHEQGRRPGGNRKPIPARFSHC